MQDPAFAVHGRVDGLYDGNSDDMWYPGRIQRVHGQSDDKDTTFYEVLYDDGEIEYHVLPRFLRAHVTGTLSVGTRVFGKYADGDEWYPGKVTEVQENGRYTLEYDDSEVETDVSLELIREPSEASFEPTADNDTGDTVVVVVPTPIQNEDADVDDGAVEPTTVPEATLDIVEPTPVTDSTLSSLECAEESLPQSVDEPAARISEPQQPQYEIERPRFHAKPKPTDSVPMPASQSQPQQYQSQPEPTSHQQLETDEYASIVESIELLGKRLADAASIKAVLSTLVKQMRAFPQVTADLVHERGGEKLVIDVLKFHDAHAVIQCYCFVLLRRLCFLCAKSTHFFLRNEIINFVTSAMRRFADDAILQASACGALAVFTRVHAGLNLLLEHRVAQLVLATIVYHKTYSIHTRQVHYYACEVLLELCELGDRATLDALCGDQVDAGLSDVSPISLLLFLLRQGLSFDDKKACCAVGTLLMCLAANNRYAAGLILRLNGLPELSTVMAKYPSEPGIQKYSAGASKEIALSSIQKPSPARRVKETASEILQESGSLEELHHERFHQANNGGGSRYTGEVRTNNNSRPSVGGRSRTPGGTGTGKRKTAPVAAAYPSPIRGQPALSYKDPLSFSKFASPIGKAPYLPSNMTSSLAANSSMTTQQQRSSLVILDGNAYGSDPYERKQFVKEERQSLLFETYGVQGGGGGFVRENPGPTRAQGIKRKQLKTHLVSAAESTWATPVVSPKKLIMDDMLSNPGMSSSSGQPFSSRSDIIGMGSYAPDSQRSYEMMDEPMMDDEASDHQFYYQQQQQPSYRSSELSPISRRSQQQQQVAKKKKKTTPGGREPSFQIKIESETQLRISKDLSSPFASPISPSHKRSKASSSSKTGVRSLAVHRGSSHGYHQQASGSSTVKKPMRQDESLNAYAAKLFHEDFGLDGDNSSADFVRGGGGTTATLSAREQAEIQERERLSFAEKLHKMIDKAKSTLAVSNVTTSSACEPTVWSSRSTTSSKSSNGSKLSVASRPPAPEGLVPQVAVGERPVAPAAKKTRVTSSGATPRKIGRETAGDSMVSSPPSELSTSSQTKSQAGELKKSHISGRKISILSTPKRPVAAFPVASAKSTSNSSSSTAAGNTSRASKPEPGKPMQTPKSASKTKPAVSSIKTAKPTTPAAPVPPAAVIKEARDDHEGVKKSTVVKQEVNQEDTAAVPAIVEPSIEPSSEPIVELPSEESLRTSAGEAVSVTGKDNLEVTSFPLPQELQEQQTESSSVNEKAIAASEEAAAESQVTTIDIHESEEPVPVGKDTQTGTSSSSEEAVVDNASVDESSLEEVVASVETTCVPESIVSADVPSEAVNSVQSLDPETRADSEAVDNSETGDADLSVAVMEKNSDEPVADAPPPTIDAAPVDDIYADEYNEFDDDGAGDEAVAEALDEQIADDAEEDQLSGKASLDDLLSMADQITEVPSPPKPELTTGAEESEAAEPDTTMSSHENDQPPEVQTLTSSKSGEDLYADETTAELEAPGPGSTSAHPTVDLEAVREQVVRGGDGSDAITTSDELISESQIEEDPSSFLVESVAGASGEVTVVAGESILVALLEVSEQPSVDYDVQESVDIAATATEDMVEKNAAAEDSNTVTSAAEDATSEPEAIQASKSQESSESSAVDEVASSPEDGETTAAVSEPSLQVSEEPVTPEDATEVITEAEVTDEMRPVSRGADSYAEDGFDFEPEEGEGDGGDATNDAEESESPASADATRVEDSPSQDDAERTKGEVQTPQPAVEATEPIESTELPQEPAADTEAAVDLEGDQNAVDERDQVDSTTELVDDEAESKQSDEAEVVETSSKVTLEPAGDEIEPPSTIEEAVQIEDAETSAAVIPDSQDAEDTKPSDDAVEATVDDVEAPLTEASASKEDAQAEEAAIGDEDADEYGDDYSDADFEETAESSAQDAVAVSESASFEPPTLVENGAGDESAPPDEEATEAGAVVASKDADPEQDASAAMSGDGDASVVDPADASEEPIAGSEEADSSVALLNEAVGEPKEFVIPVSTEEGPCESTRDGDEQVTVEPALDGESSDEIVQVSEEASETTEPFVDELVSPAADGTADLQGDKAQNGDDDAASPDSEPAIESVESVPETVPDAEVVGEESTVGREESDAQVEAKAEVETSAFKAEQGDLDNNSESYGDESGFVGESEDPPSEPIDTESPPASDTDGADTGANEAKETDEHDATADARVEEIGAAVSEDPTIPGDSSAAEETHGEETENDSTAESAVPPSAQGDAEQSDADGQVSTQEEHERQINPESPVAEEKEQLEDVSISADASVGEPASSVDEPASEDDYRGDAAEEEAFSTTSSEVQSGEQPAPDAEPNEPVDSKPASSADDESIVLVPDWVADATAESEFVQSTVKDTWPETEELPVDSVESVVVSDEVEEDAKLELPAIVHIDSNHAEAAGTSDEPESAGVVSEEVNEPDADEGYEDFEEGEASQGQSKTVESPAADPDFAEPESPVNAVPETEVDTNPEEMRGEADNDDSAAAANAESVAGGDESEAQQREATEKVTIADDTGQEDLPTSDESTVAADSSEMAEPPSSTTDLDDEVSNAASEEEEHVGDLASGERATVESSGAELNQLVEETDDAAAPSAETEIASEDAVPESGEDAQLAEHMPEDDGKDAERAAVGDGNAEPETSDVLSPELDEDEGTRIDAQAADVRSAIENTDEVPQEAIVDQQLSTESESETQQSSPEFASYDDFEEPGDDETIPPLPVSESTLLEATNNVEDDPTTESLQVVYDAEAKEGVTQETEPPLVIDDGDHEPEIVDKEPIEAVVELSAAIEPVTSKPTLSELGEAILASADPDTEADSVPATSIDAEPAEDQSSSEPVAENADFESEPINSESTTTEAEQPGSEDKPLVVQQSSEVAPVEDADGVADEAAVVEESAVLADSGRDIESSEPESVQPGEETTDRDVAQPIESDARGAVDGDEEEQSKQSEAEAAPEPSEVAAEEAIANDSVPDSEPSELQPDEAVDVDDVESEPEQSEAATLSPANEQAPRQDAQTDEQTEADEAEAPKIDQYDDFEAEAEEAVVEASLSSPESVDAYDDFKAEAEPILQVQHSSEEPVGDIITPAMGSESPSFDLYDDFEANGDEASPVAPPAEVKSDEPAGEPTAVATEDEADEYAEEEAEYNDFEEDDDGDNFDKLPTTAAQPVVATGSPADVLSTESTPREIDEDDDDMEPQPPAKIPSSVKEQPADDEDYAVEEEEEFESDKKPSTATVPVAPPTAKPPAAIEKPAQEDDAENEYEADYDAEYDDFED